MFSQHHLEEPAAREKLKNLLQPRAKPTVHPAFPGTLERSSAASLNVRFPGGPTYRDQETQVLSEALRSAFVRQQQFRENGGNTTSIDGEILQLRRQLREGGQLREGDSLRDGHYLLWKRLGSGGFATVWQAKDLQADKMVAIKVLHAERTGHGISRERFFRGATVMQKLAGTGIVPVLEAKCEEDGFCFFVMDFIDGGNLRDAVLAGTVTRDDAIPIMRRLCEILSKAHQQDAAYVHRDVKPTNVLRSIDGNLWLSDFDLVAANNTTGGTRTGAMGSLPYAAPEQVHRPQNVDGRADIFSIAMTGAFIISASELPHIDAYWPEFVDNLTVDTGLKSVLTRALAKDPNDRFATAEAFNDALAKKFASTGSGRPARKAKRTRRAASQKGTRKQPPRHPLPPGKKRKVMKAMETYDLEHRGKGRYCRFDTNSLHRYAIAYEDQLYPVKLIISLATGLPTNTFSGGPSANKWVSELGFTVIELNGSNHETPTPTDS